MSRSSRHSLCRAALIGLISSVLAGCLMSAPTPMRSLEFDGASQPAKCLFVLLPGRGDPAKRFREKGFVEEIQGSNLSVDIRAADATLGYYMRGTMLDRLEADVIAPARARGYQEIWLIGNSMGGLGSLLYAQSHPTEIAGVLAIAPFLGDKDLIAEIAAAGGLTQWPAPPRNPNAGPDNYQRELWRWLQAAVQGLEPAPPIFLGYGDSDRMRDADSLLAEALPPSRVFLTSGGHEWTAWRRVLARFLKSSEFAQHCR